MINDKLSYQDKKYVVGEYIVERNGLIAQIWGGDLSEGESLQGSPLAGLLESLMDVQVITLASDAEMKRPIAVMEETEILDGASLGDVLSEEMGIEVPYGALILVMPKDFSRSQDMSGQKLGEILGHIILDMTQGQYSVSPDVSGKAKDLVHLAASGQAAALKLSGLSGSRLQ